ncbi:hypothetical protein FOQG_17035 [Fusarium oxysporum f. sp. raphani 54005]|uniref:Uncharacterized protein n=1 Tax=Fusarium oxysporum f. sp. raphani 54005 TaxID=1089458 RepID=X0C6B8_FUSOX|nr:hypothetical protein FOQG_17035 [Fusarium oxysporum f. sp. raphani 54005]
MYTPIGFEPLSNPTTLQHNENQRYAPRSRIDLVRHGYRRVDLQKPPIQRRLAFDRRMGRPESNCQWRFNQVDDRGFLLQRQRFLVRR